jgi:acetate kinase
MNAALEEAFQHIGSSPVDAVGNRVVHGGDRFREPVLVTDAVEQAIEQLSALAPLHNPHNLAAMRAARRRLPQAKHVAVFDTAFHATIPPHAYVYGLPWEFLEKRKIRRYGFHGISHRYISERFREITGASESRLISCHLGNGCSVCAVENGRSVDTSMGFTPLEGLVMGTRSGDVDAGAVLYLLRETGMKQDDLLDILNSHSGLAGVSGISNDMRDLLKAEAEGNTRASLAIDLFCYRVRKYIGAYLAAMNGADAVIFTGGIGEHSPEIRARICAPMDRLGIVIDAADNSSAETSPRRIGKGLMETWVIPTDEELLIARDTLSCRAGTH